MRLILFFGLFASTLLYAQSNTNNVTSLYNEFLDYWNKEDLKSADRVLHKLNEDSVNLSNYQRIIVLENLGLLNKTVGKLSIAKSYYIRALSYCQFEDMDYTILEVRLYQRLGIVEMSFGNYTNSLEHFNKAEGLIEVGMPGNELRQSYVLVNKGDAQFYLGDYHEAIRLFNQAAQIRKDHAPHKLPLVFSKIAKSYDELNQIELAQKYYYLSLSGFEDYSYNRGFQIAPHYFRYAEFLVKNNILSGADRYLYKSLMIFDSNFGTNNRFSIGVYAVLAEYYCMNQDFDSSLVYIDKAFSETASLSSFDRNYIYTFNVKASLYNAWGNSFTEPEQRLEKYTIARETVVKALEVVANMHASYLSEQNRLVLLENEKEFYSTGIDVCLKLYDLTNDKSYLEDAYKFSSSSKGFELRRAISTHQSLYEESLPIEIRDSIDTYQQIISECKYALDEGRIDSEDQKKLVTHRMYDAYRSYESFVNQAKEVSPVFQYMSDDKLLPDIQNLQTHLRRNECIIEYYITDHNRNEAPRLITFFISRKDLHSFETEIDTSFFKSIQNVTSGISQPGNTQIFKDLSALHQMLIAPLRDHIRGKDLIIIPDEVLQSLPFEALITNPFSEISASQAIPYLINEHAISYAYSSSILFSENSRKKRKPCVTSVFPEYEADSGYGIYPLDGNEQIIDEIQQHFSCTEQHKNINSKSEFLHTLENEAIIYLSMHAYRPENMDLPASLLLPDSVGLQRCFDYEIETLNISSPLVVLDACETGAGKFYSGDGAHNLARSFLLAGTPSLIQTMWEVEDNASSDIIGDFFHYLGKGHNKSKALQKARLNYIEEVNPNLSHPAYWSAYQLLGDPIPLNRKFPVWPLFLIVSGLLAYYFLRKRRANFRASFL